MYDGLYGPVPDCKRYLQRIGIDGPVKPDLHTLNHLIAVHQQTVPFENLDVYDAGVEISLNIEDLFDKVVVRRRGGYCYELNGLFMSLLESIGFSCQATAARITWKRDYFPPLSHRATVVTLDGERYFCDVGFGGPSPDRAIRLDDEGQQQAGGTTFQFMKTEREFELVRLVDTTKEVLMMFADTPFHLVDFLPLNELTQKPGALFTTQRVVSLRTETGSVSIEGNILRRHENGDVNETVLYSEEDVKAALREFFEIQVDFPLKFAEI